MGAVGAGRVGCFPLARRRAVDGSTYALNDCPRIRVTRPPPACDRAFRPSRFIHSEFNNGVTPLRLFERRDVSLLHQEVLSPYVSTSPADEVNLRLRSRI
jgi:hypothetical protein